MKIPYVYSKDSVTCFVNGKPQAVHQSHVNYNLVLEAIKAENWDAIPNLINVATAIKTYTADIGGVTVEDGEVMYNGKVMHNALTSKIIEMMREGFNVNAMVAFMGNLMKNPSATAVNELYLFMESGSLPITDDGHILAYKKVRGDYKDIYSGTMDNSIGQVLEIPRNEVDDNRDRTCSYGLHFCSYSYLKSYGASSENRVVIVQINPADIVSIPSDYGNAKGRTCRYEVVGEVENWKENEELSNSAVANYSKEEFDEETGEWFDDELENCSDEYCYGYDDDEDDELVFQSFTSRKAMRDFCSSTAGYVSFDLDNGDAGMAGRIKDIGDIDDDARWFAIYEDSI